MKKKDILIYRSVRVDGDLKKLKRIKIESMKKWLYIKELIYNYNQ